jgi:hypothetical protein
MFRLNLIGAQASSLAATATETIALQSNLK